MWGGSGSNAEKNTLLILIVVGEVNFFRGLTKIKDLQGLFDTWLQNVSPVGLLLRTEVADMDRDRSWGLSIRVGNMDGGMEYGIFFEMDGGQVYSAVSRRDLVPFERHLSQKNTPKIVFPTFIDVYFFAN